ncbi:hypothetical protein EV182_006589, partial [Spiromyces aspiralis]
MSLANLIKKHPSLKPWDIDAYKAKFDDTIDTRDAIKCIEELLQGKSYDEIREVLKQVMSRPAVLDFEEFVEVRYWHSAA